MLHERDASCALNEQRLRRSRRLPSPRDPALRALQRARGAVNTTFVQVYLTLRAIAEAKGTFDSRTKDPIVSAK
jgi:hypothetical protein